MMASAILMSTLTLWITKLNQPLPTVYHGKYLGELKFHQHTVFVVKSSTGHY